MKTISGDAVSALGKLRPSEANLIVTKQDDGVGQITEKVNVDLIETGDLVKVMHGSSPPCDATLVDEEASFDESSLTGESRLVNKQQGDNIYSGTINKGPAVTMRVSGPAGASMLDSIIAVVREGQSKRAPMERIADLLTAYFAPIGRTEQTRVILAKLWWRACATSACSQENVRFHEHRLSRSKPGSRISEVSLMRSRCWL